MARRRRIIAAAALACTAALVPLQAPRPRRTVSRYSEAVDEDTLLPSGDAAAAPDTDRRPRNGNRQNQGGGRGRIIQLSNPMRLVRKQRPGGDRRGPPGGQRLSVADYKRRLQEAGVGYGVGSRCESGDRPCVGGAAKCSVCYSDISELN